MVRDSFAGKTRSILQKGKMWVVGGWGVKIARLFISFILWIAREAHDIWHFCTSFGYGMKMQNYGPNFHFQFYNLKGEGQNI